MRPSLNLIHPALLVCLGLAAATLFVYWQVGSFDFISYDDAEYVYENYYAWQGLTPQSVAWAFTARYAANWHPLTWLSHMLDVSIFGMNPGPMHMVNLLFHLANSMLLLAVLKRMTGALWPSAFVAAAFALHPMHVESVAWVAERKDLLSTFFLLVTLLAWTGYAKSGSKKSYLASLCLYALGLMAKPMLVTAPFLLLLLDYWPLGRMELLSAQPRRKRSLLAILRPLLIEKIPFFVLAAASSVVTFLVQNTGGAVSHETGLPLLGRLANASMSYGTYIGKLFWPHDMYIPYPLDSLNVTLWHGWVVLPFLLAITALIIRYGRSRPWLPVGWFWFLGTLLPVIGLVQVGTQSMADRYTYIPYVGLFIILAWGIPALLPEWNGRKAVLGIWMIVALASLALVARHQAAFWRNGVTLFSNSITNAPYNFVAYHNRGMAHKNRGEWLEAISDYKMSLSMFPRNAKALREMGFAYGALGRIPEAMDACNESLKLYESAIAFNNRGVAYGKLGRHKEAMDSFRRATELEPESPDPQGNLARELFRQGMYDEAAGHYRMALKHRPDWPESLNDLAWLMAAYPGIKSHNPAEAVTLAEKASKLTGGTNPGILDTLAATYAAAGRFPEAVSTARLALKLAATSPRPGLAEGIQQHLDLYTQGKPWTEQ
jgi:protein O-mannosyl-transferase